jgi:GNAT superfamily N-acetyltransferase
VEIRRAAPDDAPRLKEIIVESKGYWHYPQSWMSTWAGRVALTPEDIRDNEAYVARAGEVIAGFYMLIPRGGVCVLDHLWVVPERIGSGIGRALFAHALDRARALGASRMEFECDPHAVGFYKRMGAQYLRDTVSELEGVLPVMDIAIHGRLAPGHSAVTELGG